MGRAICVFLSLLFGSAFAVADSPHAYLTPVKTHHHVQHHHAHKATKHHTPKHHHNSI